MKATNHQICKKKKKSNKIYRQHNIYGDENRWRTSSKEKPL